MLLLNVERISKIYSNEAKHLEVSFDLISAFCNEPSVNL